MRRFSASTLIKIFYFVISLASTVVCGLFFGTALVILLARVQHIYKEHFELFCFGVYVLVVVVIEIDLTYIRILILLTRLLALIGIFFFLFYGCFNVYEGLSFIIGRRWACVLLLSIVLRVCLFVILRRFGPGLLQFIVKLWSVLCSLIDSLWS